VGASIAETLRHQADDLRQRRREQALVVAQALPVKLVFPLIVCFLPGIFISTLGPVLYQMIQVADSVLRPIR
jgi:tight adherence protein C